MKQAIINFNMHQPFRLHPGKDHFIWEEKNQEVFQKSAQEYYLPSLEELASIVRKRQEFKFSVGMSGTFLEQAQLYSPAIISAIKDLVKTGAPTRQVELLVETYYNSLASLFADKQEFRSQVSEQRSKLRDLFGYDALSFRHTKRLFNNDIGAHIADMGFKVALADLPHDAHDRLYRAKESGLLVLPRNVALSHLISRGDTTDPLLYAERLAATPEEFILTNYALGRVGGEDFRGFWPRFVEKILSAGVLEFKNPADMVTLALGRDLPSLDIPLLPRDKWNDWQDACKTSGGVINNETEYELFKRIEHLQGKTEIPKELQRYARILTGYDNLRFLHEDPDSPATRGNPYGGRVNATYVLTNNVTDLENRIADAERNVRVMRKRKKDIILQVSNEINNAGGLSRGFGYKTELIDTGIGGQAIAVDNLSNGLLDLGKEVYIATLDMPERNKRLLGEKDVEAIEREYKGVPDRIFAAKSPAFDTLMNPYANKEQAAAALQLHVVYNVIPALLKRTDGALIIDMHDGMAAGIVVPFAEKLSRQSGREIKLIYHAHNVHEIEIPRQFFYGLKNHPDILQRIFWSAGKDGVVNGTLGGLSGAHEVIVPSPEWKRQLVTGDYSSGFVPEVFAREFRIKNNHGQAHGILNRPSPSVYPENNKFLKNPQAYMGKYFQDEAMARRVADLITPIRPDMKPKELEHAIRRNSEAVQLIAFGNYIPEAVMGGYCGRIDDWQKQTGSLPHIIGTVNAHFRSQGRLVRWLIHGDQTPNEHGLRPEEERLRAFALNDSNGEAAFFGFNGFKELEAFAAAAVDLYISPHKEEMCGNPDYVAYLNGVFGAFTHRGGPVDKGEQLRLKVFGATRDHGNCYFHERDSDSIITAYKTALNDIFTLKEKHKDVFYRNKLRIMNEAREKFSVEQMALETLAVYEKSLGRKLV
jgi:alpha-amylase